MQDETSAEDAGLQGSTDVEALQQARQALSDKLAETKGSLAAAEQAPRTLGLLCAVLTGPGGADEPCQQPGPARA